MFSTLGPYPLPHYAEGISNAATDHMWSVIGKNHPGADKAIGVYVFAVERGRSSFLPVYVGKTDKGFRSRLNQHWGSKGVIPKLVKKYGNPTLHVFLLPRVTPKTKVFRVRGKSKLKSIDRLEFMMIASCLAINNDLENAQEKVFHQGLTVPGYLNEGSQKRTASAQQFAKMMKID